MEEEDDIRDDDYIYPSDFEEEFEYVVGVEEILQNHQDDGSLGTHFTLSDWETNMEGTEDYDEPYGCDGDSINFSSANIPISTDESSSLSFDHVSIETFPKNVHFTFASMILMIQCLQNQVYPSFEKIRESDSTFCPLSKSHGHRIDVDDVVHNIERWKKLQDNVQLILVEDGVALAPIKQDSNGKQIPPIELWSSIVENAHVDVTGKHLPLTPTLNAIHAKWSTDIRVGGIHASYVRNCLHTCCTCEDSTFWNENLVVSLDAFGATLDEICINHKVLRRLRNTKRTKSHIVKYYRCHRGGNKTRPHRKGSFIRVMENKNSQQDRKSRLCNCSSQLKTMEPIFYDNGGGSSNEKNISISIHSRHTEHVPGSDSDLLFLPVHPVVLGMAEENLKRVISTSTVALASKTNQCDLPLYAAIVPNQDGKGVPVFYMLCTKDQKQNLGEGHEGIALELALTAVFANIGNIRPSAIIIDKHRTSLNSIEMVVNMDEYCWTMENEERVQVAGKILLCHFHVMKAWSENLLTRVSIMDKDKLWRALHILMHCPQEEHFNLNLQKFYEDFGHIPGVKDYIQKGWAGETTPWRKLWPRFGRLFAYGGIDTTNHVERHWEWIKYTLLQGKVNRSLRDLIVAIVGSAADGSRIGGPTLMDHFQTVQLISRFSRRGNDKEHRRRLKGGERILKAYKEDPDAILEVVNTEHMLFYMTSESSPSIKYSVSLNTHYCNCPARQSTCKHILGLQLIVKEFFSPSQSSEVGIESMDNVDYPNNDALSHLRENDLNMGGSHEDQRRSECKRRARDLCRQVEELMSHMISSMDDCDIEEAQQKEDVLQRIVESMSMPFTFPRPPTIDLPVRGSIAHLQENVQRTRMGHGQKRKMSDDGEGSSSQPPSKHPTHVLVAHSKRKRTVFPRVLKAHCHICMVNNRIEEGDEYVVCKNCETPLTLELICYRL
ncbi:uncharacterized protein [Physcomitrium patens]|uniref:uncharacterized protein isoform X2 n=1 Tax=Physcomitrium patens TaxID=3218 RepID=UPI000D17D586|nr:uncharacterized protein LOC112294457 isoform X2 [Physcomitrium patens]|eukprot:XP_024400655.1 uncharacterized protein LOC112294457 isoform X2 [Physcomitrella patens]